MASTPIDDGSLRQARATVEWIRLLLDLAPPDAWPGRTLSEVCKDLVQLSDRLKQWRATTQGLGGESEAWAGAEALQAVWDAGRRRPSGAHWDVQDYIAIECALDALREMAN